MRAAEAIRESTRRFIAGAELADIRVTLHAPTKHDIQILRSECRWISKLPGYAEEWDLTAFEDGDPDTEEVIWCVVVRNSELTPEI